jgi:Uncharacterized conserved protein (DUF2358)
MFLAMHTQMHPMVVVNLGNMWNAFSTCRCLFADPFAGFKGLDRFKKNVSNLGGLMEDIDLELLDWREGPEELQTKWRFSAILQLPWRPRLVAAGEAEACSASFLARVLAPLRAT